MNLCKKGHDMDEVGVYVTRKGDRVWTRCRRCKLDACKARDERRRVGKPTKKELEAERDEQLLLLEERRWRAATWWEREEIEAEIENLRKRA